MPGRNNGRGRHSQHEPDDPARDLGPPADAEAVARTILLDKLTGRARSRHELAEALAAKDVPADVAVSVLDRFEQVGLIDDGAFAEAWIEFQQHTRGLARRALSQELRRKGIDDELVRESVDRIDPDVERATARGLVDRKLRSTRALDRDRRFRRLTSMLARKGYPAGLAIAVVRAAMVADERACGHSEANDLDDVVMEDFG